jgi:hypothetical protein
MDKGRKILAIGSVISLWLAGNVWGQETGENTLLQWKTYKDKDYKYEIKYPRNFVIRKSYFPEQKDKLIIVRFLAPEHLSLEKTAFRSSFLSIWAKKVNPKMSLEDYIKRVENPALFSKKEINVGFKVNRSEAQEKFDGLSYFDKVAIGEGIPGYLLHFWGKTGISYIYIKHEDVLIEISSHAIWREGIRLENMTILFS